MLGLDVFLIHKSLEGGRRYAVFALVSLQAVGDNAASTAMETGIIRAREHLRPSSEGGQGRHATDKIVGRLASDIAVILMGTNKPTYTPHVDTGDFVKVTNVDKVVFTGNKWK